MIILPDIEVGTTLYWVIDKEIIPLLYNGIHDIYLDTNKKYHVRCETSVIGNHIVDGYPVKNQSKRILLADAIGDSIFLSLTDAKTVLKEKKANTQEK